MISEHASIYLAHQSIDLRASFDVLSGVVKHALGREPRSGNLFVFLNRRRDRAKVLFYDRTGYCLLYKRLDRGTFQLPTVIDPSKSHLEISMDEMTAILRGLDLGEATKSTRPVRNVRKKRHEESSVH